MAFFYWNKGKAQPGSSGPSRTVYYSLKRYDTSATDATLGK